MRNAGGTERTPDTRPAGVVAGRRTRFLAARRHNFRQPKRSRSRRSTCSTLPRGPDRERRRHRRCVRVQGAEMSGGSHLERQMWRVDRFVARLLWPRSRDPLANQRFAAARRASIAANSTAVDPPMTNTPHTPPIDIPASIMSPTTAGPSAVPATISITAKLRIVPS